MCRHGLVSSLHAHYLQWLKRPCMQPQTPFISSNRKGTVSTVCIEIGVQLPRVSHPFKQHAPEVAAHA